MTTSNVDEHLLVQAASLAAERPLRRSFLTGKLLDPELHPRLRTRIARAFRKP